MYNKKTLSKASAELDKAKAPKKPKDIITDPMGQWKYPGLPTRIPSNDITMKGVGYPVLGVANNGQRKIMLPGADYTFPGADYVDEYPQMRKGGAKKKKTKSLSGTNKIMLTHPLLQNYKNKVYDPNVDYFQDGGEKDTIIYPPGDSEYMDQPSYNYDIIEMLNQKARRGYEEYMHDQTDPTNINRTSPAYQQKFHMREGLIQAQDGGDLNLELTQDEIDQYVKGGYIVEDISVPELNQAQKGGFKPIPLPLDKTRSETTQRVSLPSRQAIQHIKNKPGADKAKKKEKKEIQKFKKQLWKEYEKLPLSEKVSDRVGAFFVDPAGMTARALTGDQAYLPGMGKGLLNHENPEIRDKYLKELGYTKGEFDASDLQNMVNPFYWASSLVNNTEKGNYGTAALEALFMGLPKMPKGSFSPSTWKQGANMIREDLSKGLSRSKPKPTRVTNIGLDTYSGDSFTPIRLGDDNYKYAGQEWYYVDPEDYGHSSTWKKEALDDAGESLNKLFNKLPNYGKETFDVGNFNYKAFSEGDNAIRDLYAKLSKQKQLTADDFYTDQEVLELANKYKKHLENLESFDKNNPLDPAEMIFGALTGQGNARDELFNTLYPNSFQPSFREKFLTPAQEQLLKHYNFRTGDKGSLEKNSLKNFGDMFFKPQQNIELPSVKNLKEFDNPDHFFYEDPKVVVSEMRGTLGLSLDDIEKLSSEELLNYRNEVINKLKKQAVDRVNENLKNKFTGPKAWQELIKNPGYYNKLGGLIEAQKGGIKTHKSEDGTVTNTITKANGDTVIQVKTKNGKYYEKLIKKSDALDTLSKLQGAVKPEFLALGKAEAETKREEKQAKQKFLKEAWSNYDDWSTSDKVSDRVGAFLNDPFGMTARAITGEQAYIPGMAQGLHDYENPEVRERYLKELGYTPGEFDASDIQNMINPGNWVTSITENTRKGNVEDAVLDAGLMVLPHLPKGTISKSNIKSGVNLLKNDVKNAGKGFGRTKSYELPGSPNVTSYYHGSPWRWEDDLFDESMIGKGEGATKRMRGLNLFPEENLYVAPKFANIKSADAPIHIGSSNKIEQSLLDKLNPTVYKFDDIGNNLKLKEVSGRQIKNLKQEDLIKEGFDGIRTDGQITVFPSSVHKLTKSSAQSIEEFVKANPNVKNWTKWTTNPKEFERITGLKLTAKELEELKEATKQLPGSPNAVNDVQKAGFDGNFLTRPLTLFTKNELLGTPDKKMLYRKIGNAKGLQDLIEKQGAQAPKPMRMTSGATINTPFFGAGTKPNENYGGLFAVEVDPSNPKYSWSNNVGGVSNYGVAPYNPETGELMKNIPLEDLNVYKKKWFSNNYKKLKPEELKAALMFAREQALIENAYKWGVRGTAADQIFNDGDYAKAIQNYFLGKPDTSRKKREETNDNYEKGGIVADLTPEEIQDYIAQGYTIEEVDEPELIEAQKGIISTKEHTDKKGNKTIKVQKEDGTVYTKVISKDGKVYNRTFDPKKDSWLTDQTKNLYSKAQGAGNSDWFWGPAALTAITAAPLLKSAATAVGEGIVAGGDAIANATLNKLGKNSFLRATKSAFNAAPSWLPSGATANNLLTAAGATYGTAEYFDKNSDIRKSYSKVAKDPTLRNIGDAVSETGLNMLDFIGLGLGNKALSAPKYLKKLGKINKLKSNKVLDDVIDINSSTKTTPALAKTNTEYSYGMHPDNPYRQKNVRTYSKEETELLEKNLPENLKTEKVDNWAYVPEELRTREAQTKAFNEATEMNDRWVYTDPKKFKELEDVKKQLQNQVEYTAKEYQDVSKLNFLKSPFYAEFFKKNNTMSLQDYYSKKFAPSSPEELAEVNKIEKELEEFIYKNLESNPEFKKLQPKIESIEKQKDLIRDEIKKIALQQDGLVDPLFKSKVNNILDETNNPSRLTSLDYNGVTEVPPMRDPKLVHVDEQSMMDLPDYDKDYIKENLNKIAGVNTHNNTIILASRPDAPIYYKKVPKKEVKLLEPKTWLKAFKKNNIDSLDDQELIKYVEQKMIDPTTIEDTNIHELGHDNQKYKDWLRGLADMDPTTGYLTKKGDSKLAKEFEEAMVEPTKLENPDDRFSTESWNSAVNELHSDLQIARLKAVKYYMKNYNLSLSDATGAVKNLEAEGNDELYDFYIDVADVNQHFKSTTSDEVKRKLLKVFPAVVPTAISIAVLNKKEEKPPRRFKEGGVVAELSDDEIQDYINQGYVVEEV
jgi:hypothetical protein